MKIIFLLLLAAMTNAVAGQTSQPQTDLTREALLIKSKRQQTWASIIAVPAGGLLIAGLIMYMHDFSTGWTDDDGKKSRTADKLMYAGGGLALLVIPLQIASNRNKKLAASLSFENRRMLYPQSGCLVSHLVPSLSLKVKLSK